MNQDKVDAMMRRTAEEVLRQKPRVFGGALDVESVGVEVGAARLEGVDGYDVVVFYTVLPKADADRLMRIVSEQYNNEIA